MATLTVIIPTYNEEQYIQGALHSVKFADQIIVIDSHSSDHTRTLAKPHADLIIDRKFDHFSAQKNAALVHATGEWVLFLDADERVTHSLAEEIGAALQNPRHGGYKINFPHFYMNRFLYHHSDDVLRLVGRDGAKYTGLVHEKLQCKGSIGKLRNPMLHYTYKDLEHYISKKESYAEFQAQQLQSTVKKVSWYHLCIKPAWRFFSSLVLKGGFRDGIPGLAVAAVNAYGVFCRYVKLIESQRITKADHSAISI